MAYITETKNGNGIKKYKVTADIGIDENGNRKRSSKTFSSKKAAKAYMRNVEEMKESGCLNFKYQNITLNDFIENTWFPKYCKGKLKDTTYDGYLKIFKRNIKPSIGKKVMSKITTDDVQDWLNEINESSPSNNDKKLGYYSVRNSNCIIKSAMKKAEELKYIKESPCKYTKLPKNQRKQAANFYDKEDIAKLFKALENENLEVAVKIELAYGLRRGEVLALKWDNIDWQKKTISIVSSRVIINGKVCDQSPKSSASERTLPIPENLFNFLYKEYSERKAEKGFSNSKYIVLNSSGKPYNPDNFSQAFKRFITRKKLKKIKFHELRHTVATQIIDSGASPKTAQKILGHADITTTLDIYSHAVDKSIKSAINDIDDLYN